MSATHSDPAYVCLNDPVCRDWWDGYYAPAHSIRCAHDNEVRLARLSTHSRPEEDR